MQLLNSKILSNDKNTRYSNKKAQDTRVTCAFLSVVAFSYYKDGGDAGICLTAIVTEGQSRAAEGVHVAKQRHGFCRAKSPLRNKKRNSLRCSFFVFNIRKSYTKDIAIMLCFYKKRKKNQEYYPGLFSYYICTKYPTE